MVASAGNVGEYFRIGSSTSSVWRSTQMPTSTPVIAWVMPPIGIGCVGLRGDIFLDVRLTESLLPFDLSVAQHRRRQAGNPGLQTQRFDVSFEQDVVEPLSLDRPVRARHKVPAASVKAVK